MSPLKGNKGLRPVCLSSLCQHLYGADSVILNRRSGVCFLSAAYKALKSVFEQKSKKSVGGVFFLGGGFGKHQAAIISALCVIAGMIPRGFFVLFF